MEYNKISNSAPPYKIMDALQVVYITLDDISRKTLINAILS
jgi:hypothetical protein